MSNPTVSTTFANPDPNITIGNFQDLVTQLNLLVDSEVQGTYVPYVMGSSTPAVGDQDKVWYQLDSAGRPIAVKKFYNGKWRRTYSGKASEVSIFVGDPATYFDATGLGIDELDWEGWAVCNGQNGTPQMADNFLVCANNHSTIDGFSGGAWLTTVTGQAIHQGGEASYTLVNNNLPNMKVQLTGTSGYNDNGSGAPVRAVVTTKGYGGLQTTDVATFGADPTGTPAVPQVAVPTLPPFIAVCPVMFVGYP